MKTIKKYSNRRLYDTDQSEYVTLEELAKLIREGHDVEVIDVETGEDLTQSTLAQIVVESRGATRLLPVPLLTQMIRMEEDALAEFMTLYMSWAMDVYFQVKRGFRDIAPNPFVSGEGLGMLDPTRTLSRLFGQRAPWNRSGDGPAAGGGEAPAPPEPERRRQAGDESPPEEGEADQEDLASLRREIERLNQRLDEMSEE